MIGAADELILKSHDEVDTLHVARSATRLIGDVASIFRTKFRDNPKGVQIDRKLRRQMAEKEEALGIKHG